MSRTLNMEGGLSFTISVDRAAKSKLDSGIRLENRRGKYALWNRQASKGMWVVNAGMGTHVLPALNNLTFIEQGGKLFGLSRSSGRVVAWEGQLRPDKATEIRVASEVFPRMARKANLQLANSVKPCGRQIRVAASRVGNEFLHVADEYFHRPAADDFWRLEASEGDNIVISRMIDDVDGAPQVDEVSRVATAARIPFRERPTQPDNYISIAISPADEVLLLDESYNTYRLAEVMTKGDPTNRFPHPEVAGPLRTIASAQGRMLKDEIDERWAREWRGFSEYLAAHGPIDLNPKNERFQSLLDLSRTLVRAVND